MNLEEKRLKRKIHEIIFEADTPAGKVFDISLLVVIIASIISIALESVPSINAKYGLVLDVLEWTYTILFTIEYIARIYAIDKPRKYIFSFYGIIDLLAILPSFLELVLAGSQAFIVIRVFRLLRVFRVMKLVRFLGEAESLKRALKLSLPKISVFMVFILCMVIMVSTVMYIVEGSTHGFNSIPKSMYWTIVTMTTVGYGDIAPQTILGQTIASLVMLIGYAVIAVPTGIVTSKLIGRKEVSTKVCHACAREGHDVDAKFCKYCGAKL